MNKKTLLTVLSTLTLLFSSMVCHAGDEKGKKSGKNSKSAETDSTFFKKFDESFKEILDRNSLYKVKDVDEGDVQKLAEVIAPGKVFAVKDAEKGDYICFLLIPIEDEMKIKEKLKEVFTRMEPEPVKPESTQRVLVGLILSKSEVKPADTSPLTLED